LILFASIGKDALFLEALGASNVNALLISLSKFPEFGDSLRQGSSGILEGQRSMKNRLPPKPSKGESRTSLTLLPVKISL
jgi:hypothetical protein